MDELNELIDKIKKKFETKDALIESMKKHEADLRYSAATLQKEKIALESEITQLRTKLDKIQKAVGDLK